MNEILESIGLERLKEDICVYVLSKNEGTIILGVYVDYFLIVGSNKKVMRETIDCIRKYFTLTESKEKNFLNISIRQTEKEIILSQENYANKILEKYNLLDSKGVKTPLDVQQDLDNYEDSPQVDETIFQEMIGSLMYLSVGTRPDISYGVSRLSQYSNDPRQTHLTAVKRMYRYLKATKDYKLVYDNVSVKLTISTDASWNTTEDAKSFGGYTVKLGNNLISWRSKKQELVV